ncbi:hypothetical protein [Aeromicrobium piscarium]|uniref:Thioesterase family protein n=1 Tax=Aeromicrobium piscarium TaxID=2590901 RepID=A0A554SPW2_9ACTN|nr:hypothetical protein [Aeromicrobium piscarium]TSD68358.1 hypothetical protein FNM00_01830 [Aeromicrobium piscarium]
MVTIARQFNGPPGSGNGGYASGVIAAGIEHDGPVEVRLTTPPPLDTPLTYEHDHDEVRLVTHGGALVGHARPGGFLRDAPRFASAEEIAAGAAGYPGFEHHPFDLCFTCGTQRGEGDGLRIFSGPIGDGLTAAPWDAHAGFAGENGAIDEPVTWAALDCPGGWAADFSQQPMLLGTMTAEVYAVPAAGQRYHAVGQLDRREGRKFFTSTALYTPEAQLVGRAEQVWIEIDLG